LTKEGWRNAPGWFGSGKLNGTACKKASFCNQLIIAYFPHPAKEAKPYQVEQARDFLTAIGVNP
jgi:hypothetical protein